MTHQQILDKLAAKYLVKSLDEDLARLTFGAMCYDNNKDNQLLYVLPKLLNRWNCILNAENSISDNYKQTTVLALAILLHKYGFTDIDITNKAIKAIDKLNKSAALSDDFLKKSEEIKQFILSPPIPLKRKPTVSESITFYRAKDIISIQFENRFYVAYIHEISGVNESPIVEFYDRIFDQIPKLNEIINLPAKGRLSTGNIERIAYFSISGMKYLPDLANQIQLVGSSIEKLPISDHLEKQIGLRTISNIFDIQTIIKQLFRLNQNNKM
ncbi:hypothetical protein [Flavobacterium sp. MMS24-S5]|uniref:hypothetical protein n=1 Tax=Flavobacterium sp. MMS24-S5 TaxID=3416605 RepID=UPI003D022981